MGRTSYPTPLDTTSTDIDLVGGKDAYIGMLREDKLGRMYVLHQIRPTGGTSTSPDGTFLTTSLHNGVTTMGNSDSVCVGANTTGKTITNGQYFWCMVYGVYEMVVRTSVVNAYEHITAVSGEGHFLGSDVLGDKYFCGMALQGRQSNGRARCLVDPKTGKP